jgi:CRISPR-associated protein Cas1
LLRHLKHDASHRLKRLAEDVQLDGQEITEAQAAAIYWRSLFADFERSNADDYRNGILNWGYAVLLATIGRALVSLGFDASLGFGHSSRTNPWALGSDLMEPFRPTVDAAIALAPKDDSGLIDKQTAKLAILRPLANDGPVKPAIMEAVRGYREFLDDGKETHVRYPDGPLFA